MVSTRNTLSSDYGLAGLKPGNKDKSEREKKRPSGRESIPRPREAANLNYLPSNDTLSTLISNAKFALRQGVTWDRGTIVNLLV